LRPAAKRLQVVPHIAAYLLLGGQPPAPAWVAALVLGVLAGGFRRLEVLLATRPGVAPGAG